jgi:hypothetical protein
LAETGRMESIVVYRVNHGPAKVVVDADGELATWSHPDDALTYCAKNALFLSGQADWQVVELDEL